MTSAYDPVASTAFSTLGFSAAFAGFGTSPTARPNTAFTYRLTYQNFRAAVQAQIGGYGVGNATNGMYQGQLGLDFGSLSVDGVLSWAKDAVALSSFSGSNIACLTPANCFINVNNQLFDPNTVLRATLSNNFGAELVARYKWDPFTFYGGWIYARLMNPSDDYLTGFPTISQGIFVPPGSFNNGVLTNAAVTANNFDINRILNTFWTGVRWKLRSDLEASAGFYYQGQNNFNTSPCTGTGPFISSSSALEVKPEYRSCWIGSRSSVSISTPASWSATSTAASPTASFRFLPSSFQERPRPLASIRPGRRTTTRRSASASASDEDQCAPRGAERPLVGRAADAALIAVVGVFAQPVFVALVIGIGRYMRESQAERRRLRSGGGSGDDRRGAALGPLGLKTMDGVVFAVVKMVMDGMAVKRGGLGRGFLRNGHRRNRRASRER